MPMIILKNVHGRLTFGFRRKTGIRMTCDADQLRAQLEALKFSVAEYKSQLDGLSRELAEARLEIARRTIFDVLASAPSTKSKLHHSSVAAAMVGRQNSKVRIEPR